MNARLLSRFLAVAAIVFPQLCAPRDIRATSTVTNALVSTVSVSRQFTAYADNPLLPSALCVYAERVKREWRRRMDMPDNWRDPILLVVRTRDPAQTNEPAISLAMFQTESHLKYQIRCLVPPSLDEAELLVTLVEALSLEWEYRAQPTVRGKLFPPPVMPLWLVEGLAVSIQGRFDSLLAVARRSVAAGRPARAADVLDTKALPSEAVGQQLFRANAWILTESLLALPDGSRKIRNFLTDLGTQKVASNAFWTVYHEDFPENGTLENWWTREQARRTSVSLAQDLPAEETVRQLDAILVTKLERTDGSKAMPRKVETRIDDLWKYTDEPGLRDILKSKIDQLGALRGQGHPAYRPVVDEYIEAVTWLLQGNTVRFRRAVRQAAAMKTAAERQSLAIAAYMDQAEHAYAPEELSETFKGYFRTLDQAEKLEEERRSPISDYLDKFDH